MLAYNSESEFLNSRKAAALIGVSSSTLKNWRLQGKLIRGIHYIQPNSRSTLFRRMLLLDYVQNINTPQIHQCQINQFLEERKRHGENFAFA